MTSSRQLGSTPAGAAAHTTLEFMRLRIRPWLQTREGSASAIVAILVTVLVWGFSAAPGSTAVLAGMFGVIIVSLASRFWEVRTAPPVPAFARAPAPLPGTIEVLQDDNAGFWRDNSGFLWGNRVWFAATGCAPRRLRPGTYGLLRNWHDEAKLPVFVTRESGRQWWWWQNAFYWESGDYEPEDMHALLTLVHAEGRPRATGDHFAGAQSENGHADTETGAGLLCLERELELRFAEPIPEEVKRLVFDRDGGRCVQCGSPDLIQFDHILPFLEGGGNEPANLRLLCGGCNRRATPVMGWGYPN